MDPDNSGCSAGVHTTQTWYMNIRMKVVLGTAHRAVQVCTDANCHRCKLHVAAAELKTIMTYPDDSLSAGILRIHSLTSKTLLRLNPTNAPKTRKRRVEKSAHAFERTHNRWTTHCTQWIMCHSVYYGTKQALRPSPCHIHPWPITSFSLFLADVSLQCTCQLGL